MRASVFAELGRYAGERPAELGIPTLTMILDAPPALLVTGVDRRVPGQGEEDGQGVAEVPGLPELAGDAGHVVVADEGQRREDVDERLVATHRVGQLEQVPVVQPAPDRLPQLVLGHRIEGALAHEARVVAVDDLAQQIGVGPAGADLLRERGPEGDRYRVGGVETESVRAPLDPVVRDRDGELPYRRLRMVQGHQVSVPLERLVGEPVRSRRVEVEAEPPRVPGFRPVGEHVREGRERARDVVEDAVEEHR